MCTCCCNVCNGHVPRPFWNVERVSAVLSDISCHMGRGLLHKECNNCVWHPELEFPDGLDYYAVWFTKAWEDREVSWDRWEQAVGQSLFYLQFTVQKQSLTSYTYDYAFCYLSLKLESNVWQEKYATQNTRSFFLHTSLSSLNQVPLGLERNFSCPMK